MIRYIPSISCFTIKLLAKTTSPPLCLQRNRLPARLSSTTNTPQAHKTYIRLDHPFTHWLQSINNMGSNARKRSASVANIDSNPSTKGKANKKPPATKAVKKARVQKQSNPITAWDAVTTKYPTEINTFYPSQASIPDSLSIVNYLATLPAVQGALDNRSRRIGTNPFSLALGSRGSTTSHNKYQHFHARNQSSRAQGNLKAVLAQASGTPAR